MERSEMTTDELSAILATMGRTPPQEYRARCKTPDQIALFNEIRSKNKILEGWLKDYFSGVAYRKPEGVSKENEALLKAELDKLLALYDLLWWSWADIVHHLERGQGIRLNALDIDTPASAVSLYIELETMGALEYFLTGYKEQSQKAHKQTKAVFSKTCKLARDYDETDESQRRTLEKGFRVIDQIHEREPSKALEFVLYLGIRPTIEDEGRKSPTKRRYKRYTEASDEVKRLARPYTSLTQSQQIVKGQLLLA